METFTSINVLDIHIILYESIIVHFVNYLHL